MREVILPMKSCWSLFCFSSIARSSSIFGFLGVFSTSSDDSENLFLEVDNKEGILDLLGGAFTLDLTGLVLVMEFSGEEVKLNSAWTFLEPDNVNGDERIGFGEGDPIL